MVGSYGPRPSEEYEFLTTMEEAPKGMLARGTYHIKSKFTDDDKNDHLSWEWSLAIKKDWKDWFFFLLFPPSHTRSLVHQCLPLLCFRFSFFLAIIPTSPWIFDCFSLLLSPSISLLTPLLRFHLFSFSSKFQSLHHSSHSNADWFLFAPAFITRMTSLKKNGESKWCSLSRFLVTVCL